MPPATRAELAQYLEQVPNAHPSWVDALYAVKVPLEAVDRLIQTMSCEPASPLRIAEDTMLNREIVRVNGVFGELKDGDDGNGRTVVTINAVLTREESLRLASVVGNFCQPDIKPSRRFGNNGHAVMNAARRCATGYSMSRIPMDAKVIEVGPDVKHWLKDTSNRHWKKDGEVKYVGARPSINRRDVVRMSWKEVAERIDRSEKGLYNEEVRERAGQLLESYDRIFPNKRIQDLDCRGDFVVSHDANYDIAFGDMPGVMIRCGARGWYGFMLRVKGLTAKTRLAEGRLESLGVTYRVDWKAGRIDFRHPHCNAFGYSHNVWELMKYEERNGFVWTTKKANYVYAKGPETNDELLFFSVVRVTNAIYLQQPSYVENPTAGRLRIKSVWAVGDYSDGVPRRFEPIEFCVDRMAFGKAFEKRAMQDSRGDLSQALVMVKSTNVRMWLNGTPVGVSRKIESGLIEAVAVAIEVLVAQSRVRGNMAFNAAMGAYKVSLESASWLRSMLEGIVDLRAICGNVAGPISRAWASIRGRIADVALSSLSEIHVEVADEEAHLKLTQVDNHVFGDVAIVGIEDKLEPSNYDPIKAAEMLVDAVSVASDETTVADKEDKSDSGSETQVSATPSQSTITEEQVGRGWRSEECEGADEAKAMREVIELEKYLRNATHTETRIDATRLYKARCRNSKEVLQYCTTRTQHTLLEFKSHRCVQTMGADLPEVGAVYDYRQDRFVPAVMRGSLITANVNDGWYYASNHMKVWNAEEVMEAVEYALDYGAAKPMRKTYNVTLGVPGAGKTYTMMKAIAREYADTGVNFLVLSVTKKAAEEAIEKGLEFGMRESLLRARVRTLDSYLINSKKPADLVAVDEFPMAHSGKIDAAVSIASATAVRLYGDGRQIPYDPFTAEYDVRYAMYGDTLDLSRVVFLSETHRLNADVCAAWVDLYPAIYPCKCCRSTEREAQSLHWEPIGSVEHVKKQDGVRYHTYTRAEADDLKDALRFTAPRDKLKIMSNGGLSTVHEDQGATHERVETVRLVADFDKKASKRNPSLFNRLCYVLTDMTRHKRSYWYRTVSKERDMIVKRVEAGTIVWRRELVKERVGMGLTTILDMLTNRYHPDIYDEKTLWV